MGDGSGLRVPSSGHTGSGYGGLQAEEAARRERIRIARLIAAYKAAQEAAQRQKDDESARKQLEWLKQLGVDKLAANANLADPDVRLTPDEQRAMGEALRATRNRLMQTDDYYVSVAEKEE